MWPVYQYHIRDAQKIVFIPDVNNSGAGIQVIRKKTQDVLALGGKALIALQNFNKFCLAGFNPFFLLNGHFISNKKVSDDRHHPGTGDVQAPVHFGNLWVDALGV